MVPYGWAVFLWGFGTTAIIPYPAHPGSFNKISHPLLDDTKPIYSLARYKEWLLIANTDKLLLLNIDTLFIKHKTLLRYLNPQEAAFTTNLEQNTMLVSKKDSSVWFSTTDMLYRWDMTTWLKMPTYKVAIEPILTTKNSSFALSNTQATIFKPGINTFNIQVQYTSTDNLARYLTASLVKDGDPIPPTTPGVNSRFTFQNLESGNYILRVTLYEMDGSIVHQQYAIVLEKYLWQKWWFWTLVVLILLAGIVYTLNEKRQRMLAIQLAQIKALELLKVKEAQEKKLTALRLATLSNQFRPHFIVNTLNAIGATVETLQEESIISRLGESVNIIFNHVKDNEITHPFANEWKLSTNLIEMHRLIYSKRLEVVLPTTMVLEQLQHIQIPLGLLQIPIENALMHGLGNRTQPPWLLEIEVIAIDIDFQITIRDNGVGRAHAATLSNYIKHGTGTKNLYEILNIINTNPANSISIQYSDGIYQDATLHFGTAVTIVIPKQFKYET